MTTLEFSTISDGNTVRKTCTIERAIIAGWTGRNKEAMEEHISELEELGVKRPAKTPMFYRVSRDRLTITDRIEVLGGASSGEAEFFLLNLEGEIWVGAGSDHTDREAEAVGVTLSKQMCEKVLAPELVQELAVPAGPGRHEPLPLRPATRCTHTSRAPRLLKFAWIASCVSNCRVSSRPEGSPIFVVPPPISTMGLCPVFCSQRSIMICTSEPTCSESAVQSKPI